MIDQLIESAIEKGTAKSFTLQNARDIAFAQFEGEHVSVKFVAEHLKCHENTVRSLVKFKKLKTLPRLTPKAKLLFDKAYVLKLRRRELI